jgi:hypothetical protein
MEFAKFLPSHSVEALHLPLSDPHSLWAPCHGSKNDNTVAIYIMYHFGLSSYNSYMLAKVGDNQYLVSSTVSY